MKYHFQVGKNLYISILPLDPLTRVETTSKESWPNYTSVKVLQSLVLQSFKQPLIRSFAEANGILSVFQKTYDDFGGLTNTHTRRFI